MWPTENSKLHSHVLGFEKSKHIIASKQSPFSVETTSTCQAINLSLTCNYMKASDIHALDTTDTKSLTGTSKFEVSYHEQLHTHCKGTGTSTLDTSVPLKFMPKKKRGSRQHRCIPGCQFLPGKAHVFTSPGTAQYQHRCSSHRQHRQHLAIPVPQATRASTSRHGGLHSSSPSYGATITDFQVSGKPILCLTENLGDWNGGLVMKMYRERLEEKPLNPASSYRYHQSSFKAPHGGFTVLTLLKNSVIEK